MREFIEGEAARDVSHSPPQDAPPTPEPPGGPVSPKLQRSLQPQQSEFP